MGFDDFLEATGPFGKFQGKVIFLCYVSTVIAAPAILVDVFANYLPDYRCRVPECDDTLAQYNESYLNFTTPLLDDSTWDQCSKYAPYNYNSTSLDLSFTAINSSLCSPELFEQESKMDCDAGYVYDTNIFTSSSAMEFSLTCERAGNLAILNSAYMVGVLIGSPLVGFVGDYFGRKIAFLISVLLLVAGGIGSALSPSLWWLVAMRVVAGLGGNNIFVCAFIIAVEFVVPKHRVCTGVFVFIPFAIGGILQSITAYFIRGNWRLLSLLATAPALALCAHYWLLPESVRWLMETGRHNEVRKILKEIATTNGKSPPETFWDNLANASGTITSQKNFNLQNNEELSKNDDIFKRKQPNKIINNSSVLDLFKLPNMRKKCLVNYFIWAVSTLNYYGLSANSANLGGNLFVNFALLNVIEIPSYIFVWLTLDRMGRKCTCLLLYLISGLSCLAASFMQKGSLLIVLLSLFGKFGVSAAFSALYVYASELFPTECRSVAMGSCSMWGRIGGIMAPVIAAMGKMYFEPLTLLVFGVLSLMSAGLLLMLPETTGCVLPNTLQESETFGCAQPLLYIPCLVRQTDVDLILDKSCQEDHECGSDQDATRCEHVQERF